MLVLKIKTKKTAKEKLAILDELAGSGLKYGPEYIDDVIRLADREDEKEKITVN